MQIIDKIFRENHKFQDIHMLTGIRTEFNSKKTKQLRSLCYSLID